MHLVGLYTHYRSKHVVWKRKNVLYGVVCFYTYLTEHSVIRIVKFGFIFQFGHRWLLELQHAPHFFLSVFDYVRAWKSLNFQKCCFLEDGSSQRITDISIECRLKGFNFKFHAMLHNMNTLDKWKIFPVINECPLVSNWGWVINVTLRQLYRRESCLVPAE